MSRKQDKPPLQQRVNDYLRGEKLPVPMDEPQEESIDAIFDLLKKAEEDLRIAQETVARLKSELDKVRS